MLTPPLCAAPPHRPHWCPSGPQRQYRRLLGLYGSLKSQKIGQLEALMDEQDRALLAAAEVGRLAASLVGWLAGWAMAERLAAFTVAVWLPGCVAAWLFMRLVREWR